MTDIATIAILATDGFDEPGLGEPKRRLEAAGARVRIVSPRHGATRDRQGGSVPVDVPLVRARVEDFDALVLPAAATGPDAPPAEVSTIAFIRDFHDSGKPLAALRHAPRLLIEAEVARDREMTSPDALRADLERAGAHWREAEAVDDGGIVTARDPAAGCDALMDAVREGRRGRRAD